MAIESRAAQAQPPLTETGAVASGTTAAAAETAASVAGAGASVAEVASATAASCGTDVRPMMTEEVRRDVLLRLRKVSGQAQGTTRMVEDDRYCVDVLQQLSAVSSAVESVSKVVVRNHLERCVADAIDGGDPLIYDELMRVVFEHR